MSTCKTIFEELESWVQNDDVTTRAYICVNGVRIKVNGGQSFFRHSDAVVSYFHGQLDDVYSQDGISGDLVQSFSDRIRDGQRFDESKTDVLHLHIFTDGRVQFTLKSWNNHTSVFKGTCANGLVYGFDQDQGFWVLDLAKAWVDQ